MDIPMQLLNPLHTPLTNHLHSLSYILRFNLLSQPHGLPKIQLLTTITLILVINQHRPLTILVYLIGRYKQVATLYHLVETIINKTETKTLLITVTT